MAASSENILLYVKLMTGELLSIECSKQTSLAGLKQKISEVFQKNSTENCYSPHHCQVESTLNPSLMRLSILCHNETQSDTYQYTELSGDLDTVSSFHLMDGSLICLLMSNYSIPPECLLMEPRDCDVSDAANHPPDIFMSVRELEGVDLGYRLRVECFSEHHEASRKFVYVASRHALPTHCSSTWVMEITSRNYYGMVRAGLVVDRDADIGSNNQWNLEDGALLYGIAFDSLSAYLYAGDSHKEFVCGPMVSHKFDRAPIILQYDAKNFTLTIVNSHFIDNPPPYAKCIVHVDPRHSDHLFFTVGLYRHQELAIRTATSTEIELMMRLTSQDRQD